MNFIRINSITREHAGYPNLTIARFLVQHLEDYGDKLEDILQCIDYVMDSQKGGNIVVGLENGQIAGVTILNNTGMKDYIPENILVYIAVDRSHRGKGYGRLLMEKAMAVTEGSIALHVERDNPALFLYEKLGFTNKYLEMRLSR